MKLSYDKSIDSLYIGLRPLATRRTREVEPDVVLDIGDDGAPVGYDVQHASTKRDLILSIVLAEEPQIAAE